MALDKDQLHALLADYVEGSLSESQIEEAEAYLEANPGVRAVIDRLMVDSEALRALPPVRSPIDHSEPITIGAERDLLLNDARYLGRRTPVGTPALAVAAMLALGLGLAGSAWWLLTSRPATFDYAAQTAADAPSPAEAAMQDALAASERDAAPREAAARADARAGADPLLGQYAPQQQQATRQLTSPPGGPDLQAADPVATNGPAAPAVGAARPVGATAAGTPPTVPDLTELAAEPGAGGPNLTLGASPVAASADEVQHADPANALGGFGDAASNAIPLPGPTAKTAAAIELPASSRIQLAQADDDATRAVRAILDSIPRERPALVVVVPDVAQLEPVRGRVRALVPDRRRAETIIEEIAGQAVVAATLPEDVGPMVASDLSTDAVAEVRRSMQREAGVRLVDLPATVGEAAEARRQKVALAAPRPAPDAPAARYDVYVVVVAAATTRPAGR